MDIRIAETRNELGKEAGKDIAVAIRKRLTEQREVRIIFAAAPSQREMLETLVHEPGIDWTRVAAFHMDEYIGLPKDSPQRFSMWLRSAIFDRLPFAEVHLIDPGRRPGGDLSRVCG
jgi:glucosamine-6-phosphate deaminase